MTFRLPPGATGFQSAKSAPLPRIDLKDLRGAWHAAARRAGGRVGEFTEKVYPESFHTATITGHDALHTALCHAYHPFVAFISSDPVAWHVTGFIDPPTWAGAYTDAGFETLSAAMLLAPLDAADTSQLSAVEWHHIRYWKPPSVGALLFNRWD